MIGLCEHTLEPATKAQKGSICIVLPFFNLSAGWSGWSTPRPGSFTPGKDPVPIVQKAGCAPGPVWMGAENFYPTGIRSLDRPARSESLYRLHYPGRIFGLFYRKHVSH